MGKLTMAVNWQTRLCEVKGEPGYQHLLKVFRALEVLASMNLSVPFQTLLPV